MVTKEPARWAKVEKEMRSVEGLFDVGSLIASGADLLRQDDYDPKNKEVISNYSIRIDTSTDGKNHKVGLGRMERVLQLQRKVSGYEFFYV
ncbi:hypothetical protein Tco_0360687 [Tanacetum coccineum]